MKIEIQASGETLSAVTRHLKEVLRGIEDYPCRKDWTAGSDDGFASAVVVQEEKEGE